MEGADADFAMIALNKERTITLDELQSRHKHSIYNHWKVLCTIQSTYVRGKKVYQRDEKMDGERTGLFVHSFR
jgi:allantoinase